MNQSMYVVLKVNKNDREYGFNIPLGVPFADCYDVLLQFISDVKEMEKNASENAAMKQKAEEDVKVPETPQA